MRKTKRKKAPIESTISHRVLKTYIDRNGVECIDVEYTDGERMTLKVYNPKHPFWEECRRELADIPPLHMDEIISELRDEHI
ncbi:MAG TPA: hypothetical protein VKX17_15660 [Planctomycetota bacterium]|nr:hypothetical protein [Planctomycetota bacterium]